MKAKKAIVALGCAGLLVAGSVAGTLAYLTSTTGVVENTFTVGNVAITLDEALVGENGKEITGDGAQRVPKNEYHLIPGSTYDKDPTVHVDVNSEDAYLYVKLTIQDNADLEKALNNHGLSTALWAFLEGENEEKWTPFNMLVDTATGDKTYFLSYNDVVSANEDIVLFTEIKVPGEFTNEELAKLNDDNKFGIDVQAYAVQAAEMESAKDAWTKAYANVATWIDNMH